MCDLLVVISFDVALLVSAWIEIFGIAKNSMETAMNNEVMCKT